MKKILGFVLLISVGSQIYAGQVISVLCKDTNGRFDPIRTGASLYLLIESYRACGKLRGPIGRELKRMRENAHDVRVGVGAAYRDFMAGQTTMTDRHGS